MAAAMIDNPLGGRQVPEWIADHPDQKIPDRVQDRIFVRAGGRCHLTGTRLHKGDYEFEHVKPLSMGGEHRESNLAPALSTAHKIKTAEEAGDRAKADRMRRKANGTWPKSKAKIAGRGFSSSRLWKPLTQEHDHD